MAVLGQPVPWVEPPVTKEEALRRDVPGTWIPDGFDGGSELPDDCDIDRMVYPHDEGPMERAARERQAKRDADTEGFREEAERKSREFRISEGSVTGENPGPPSNFNDKED